MSRSIALAVLAAGLATAAASPSPAAAATRMVDDDRVQCPTAPFTTIQAAVDASGPGDVVRACPGTYAEQVVLPDTAPRLQVRAIPARGARLVSPPGGLVPRPTLYGDVEELVALYGDRQVLREFVVQGRLTGPCAEGRPAAIGLHGRSTIVDRNRITAGGSDCPGGESTAIDLAGGIGGQIYGNVIEQPDWGINLQTGTGPFAVQANVITGGPALRGVGIRVFNNEFTLLANMVTGMETGIEIGSTGRSKVVNNTLRGNGDGISLGFDIADLDLNHNLVRDSVRNGILLTTLQLSGDTRTAVIRNNHVRDSGTDGIAVRAGGRQDGFVRFFNNRSLGNGGFDCVDETRGFGGTAGTENVWRGNVGVTDSPNVCVRP